MAHVYYNEIDPFAAAWLRELIKAGELPDGDVDERSIVDVQPGDLRGYRHAHFFAGIGGWAYALKLAGFPDDRPIWTGSCPCQKHSSASRGRRVAADRWPDFGRLIVACRPEIVTGEQVASAVDWIDGVCDDLEAMGYTAWASILPACSVGYDHARPRIYFVGHTNRHGQSGLSINAEVARVSRNLRLTGELVRSHGVSADVVARSGFGNAIVPQVAAEFIRAYLDVAG